MTLSNEEIFAQAAAAADRATAAKFGNYKTPTAENAAGEYWALVFDRTAAWLRKHINGVY